MDSACFDDLTRTIGGPASRRATLLGLAISALIAPLSGLGQEDASAKKKHKKRKKRRKKKKKCSANQKKCNGSCIPIDDCCSDADCGENETCQRGICVDNPPECVEDEECNFGAVCCGGTCCPQLFCCEGECVDLLNDANNCGVCDETCADAGSHTECRNGNCCVPDGFECFCTPAGSACNAETCCENGGSETCLPTGVCP